MLSVGTVTYQDARGLKRALDSVAPHVTEVLVIDGIFTDFDTGGKPKFSTDGTVELCAQYPNVVYLAYPATQVQKRQCYLDVCKTPFLLLLDTDEWVTGDWETLYKNLETATTANSWSVWGDLNHTRIIYKPNEMEYYQKHFLLKRKDREFIPDQFQPEGVTHGVIPGIRIHTDEGASRNPDLQAWIDQYQKDLMRKEEVKKFMYFAIKKARAEQARTTTSTFQ